MLAGCEACDVGRVTAGLARGVGRKRGVDEDK